MIIDPRGMDVINWTSQVTTMTDQYGPVMALNDPEDWRNWGLNVLKIIGLDATDLMNPYQYDDWREWAVRFCQVTDNALGN